MKKVLAAFAVVIVVLATAAFWFFGTEDHKIGFEIISFGVIIILVGLGMVFAFRRLSSARRGEPQEDELSKKIMQKTAALSYYISLCMWVFMIWLKDRINMDTEQVISAGIMSMAVIWFACWIVIRIRGIRNE